MDEDAAGRLISTLNDLRDVLEGWFKDPAWRQHLLQHRNPIAYMALNRAEREGHGITGSGR